jgi:CBS domain-containing protein
VKHLLTKNLSPQQKSNILTRCETFHYMHDQIILHANENREGVFLVLSGMAEVYIPADHTHTQTQSPNHHGEVLEIIKQNELIGLSNIHHFITTQIQQEHQAPPKTPIYPDQLKSQANAAPHPTLLQVRAIDDVEALFIPYDVLKERWTEPELRDYLLNQVSSRLHDVYHSLAEQINLSRTLGESNTTTILRVQDIMKPQARTIQAATADTIQTVAEKLSINNKTTAAIILNKDKGTIQGIITMHDLVNRVITKAKNTQDHAETIMTENPITIPRTAYYYEALTTMLLNGIKHLPVTNEPNSTSTTESNNPNTLAGLITMTDLLQAKQTTMLKNTVQLKNAAKHSLPDIKQQLYATLNTMLQQQVPILDTLEVMNTLFDQLVHRSIELSIEEMPKDPPTPFCFYLMGSGARKEQFLLTDQDHFLVYEDQPNDNAETSSNPKSYFADLTQKIVTNLELAGFQKCKGDMMASNPKWRGSLEQWASRIHEWTLHATNDRLLLAQNFFSYRHVYGDKNLNIKFRQTITNTLDRAKIFLYRLSQLERENPIPTLEQPIRSIFKINKKQMDLKKEVLFPYHHSLQILSLMNGITYGTPIEKIDQLHEKKILSSNFQKDLKASIATILTYYVKNRYQQHQNKEKLTSTLNLTTLTTREKEELMLSIRLIKELQSHMLSYY